MIDIIIPAYNAHKTIEQTLFSIVYQELRKKIKVYLINDCSENGYKDIVTYFSNFIDIIELKLDANRGPGYARQYGIEHSYGDYIVFMDADDVLSNCYAIKDLYNEIERLECDVLISNFVEEVNQKFLLRTKDTIWCHGKMYKRKFLQKYNLSLAIPIKL